jgi:hypothetical protein
MRWIRENKGGATALVLAAIALVVLAAFLVQGPGSDAEAVLGDVGNLGTAGANHPHNLSAGSNYARAVSEDEICIFCHTPHRARVKEGSGKPIINAPLWNHELTDATYTVKQTTTTVPVSNTALVNGIPLLSSPQNKPDGASRLCLSCHDGTVSVGAVYHRYGYIEASNDIDMVDACIGTGGGDTAGLDGSDKLTSACRAYIGTDLRTKHVVSIPMNAGLISDSIANCTAGSPINAQMYLQYPWDGGEESTVLLRPTAEKYKGNPGVTKTDGKYKSGYNYGVQCSTCHDPHYWSSTADPNTTGYRMLVVGFNTLCMACHIDCP